MKRTIWLVATLLALVALHCGQAFAGYVDAVLGDNPVVYWRLGEADKSAGQTAVNAANPGTYDGTYGGNVGDVVDSALGAVDSAAHFGVTTASGSTGDKVLVSGFPIPATDVSAELWVRGATTPNEMALLSYEAAGEGNAFLIHKSGGSVYLYRGSQNTSLGVDPAKLLDGNWNHLVVTWTADGGKVTTHLNGELVGSNTGLRDGDAITQGGTLLLGQEQDAPGGGFSNTQKLVGDLDEVALYGRTLSQTEVRGHFVAVGGESFHDSVHKAPDWYGSDVLAHWRLGELDPASPAADEVGTTPGTYMNFAASDLGRLGGLGDDPNRAANFDSSDTHYVDFGDGLIDGRTELSALMLVQVDSLNKDHALLGKGAWGIDVPILFWRDEAAPGGASDTLAALINDGSGGEARATGPDGLWDDTQWHLVGFTYEGAVANGLKLYFDGEMVASVSTGAAPFIMDNSRPLTAGVAIDTLSSSLAFDGRMDEIVFFDGVLSPEAMREIYANANIVPEPCTLALLGIGGLSLALRRRRTR